jgi:hypothetical protein
MHDKLPAGFRNAALNLHVCADIATRELIGISHSFYYHGSKLSREQIDSDMHDMRKAVDNLHAKLEALEDTLVVNDHEQQQRQYWERMDEGRQRAKDGEI